MHAECTLCPIFSFSQKKICLFACHTFCKFLVASCDSVLQDVYIVLWEEYLIYIDGFFGVLFYHFFRFWILQIYSCEEWLYQYVCLDIHLNSLGEGKLDLNLMVSVSLSVLLFIFQIFKVLVARCDSVLQDMCIMLWKENSTYIDGFLVYLLFCFDFFIFSWEEWL